MAQKLKKLVTRAKIAKMAGVSPAAVTKACRASLLPAVIDNRIDASHPCVISYIKKQTEQQTEDPVYNEAVKVCIDSGEFTGKHLRKIFKIGSTRAKKIIGLMKLNGIYKGSTSAKKLEKKKGAKLKTVTKKTESKKNNPLKEDEILLIPENIAEFIKWPLGELVEKFGTDIAFLDWLRATQTIENINEKRLKNAVVRGELVSRDLVKSSILNPVNSAHIKLLTDGSKTIARRVMAMTGAGKDIVIIEKYVKDQITSFLRPIKAKVKRLINDDVEPNEGADVEN